MSDLEEAILSYLLEESSVNLCFSIASELDAASVDSGEDDVNRSSDSHVIGSKLNNVQIDAADLHLFGNIESNDWNLSDNVCSFATTLDSLDHDEHSCIEDDENLNRCDSRISQNLHFKEDRSCPSSDHIDPSKSSPLSFDYDNILTDRSQIHPPDQIINEEDDNSTSAIMLFPFLLNQQKRELSVISIQISKDQLQDWSNAFLVPKEVSYNTEDANGP